MDSVVITGVSTGIGRGTAEFLARKGFHVFGSVRKEADAAPLKQELGDNFSPLIFDVTDAEAVKAAADCVAGALKGRTLRGLINNAGVTFTGPLEVITPDELRQQFEINTVAPLVVTQAFLPMLGAELPARKDPGRIINISSIAGRLTAPFNVPYSMSKHALESFTDGLRRELLIYGIDAIAIEPGPTRSRIWDKVEQTDLSRLEGTPYEPYVGPLLAKTMVRGREHAFPPEKVAEAIHDALTNPKPKTRYVVTPGKFRNWTLPRLLPDRLVDAAIGKRTGMTKPTP